MFAQFWALVSILQAVIKMIQEFMGWQKRTRKAEAEKRAVELEKAVEDLKNAKTDKEIWDAQDRIVRNKP